MPRPRVLLVDDDPDIRELLIAKLGEDGFDVTEACDVNGALRHIASNSFDVLVSDLHMPGAADGLTVISAMRHANPETVTILFSAFPQMDIAVKTILAQTDQILVKPSGISTLSKTIRARFAQDFFYAKPMESVATILERSIEKIVDAWDELHVSNCFCRARPVACKSARIADNPLRILLLTVPSGTPVLTEI